MKTITLTMKQRLNLDALIAQQKGTIEDIGIFLDIREKIKVTQATREQYIKFLPQGGAIIDAKVELAEPLDVDLEKNEVQRLLKLIREWPQFGVADMKDWLLPLQHGLEAEFSPAKVQRTKASDKN